MLDNKQLAAELATYSVETWIRIAQLAHAQGVDSVLLPGSPTAIAPLAAHRRLKAMLKHPGVRGHARTEFVRSLPEDPKEWSISHTAEMVRYVDLVETLAWAGSLRATRPGWAGPTPAAWSWANRLISTPFESWMGKVRLRPRPVIENANRLAAAWRWRAYADYYRRLIKDREKEMRVFATAVIKLVPAAAALAKSEGWFKPERGDFPLGPSRFTYMDGLSWADREELDLVANARSSALRAVVEHDSAGHEINAVTAWEIMVGDSKASKHPAWPFG
jgi:hypothetical protein